MFAGSSGKVVRPYILVINTLDYITNRVHVRLILNHETLHVLRTTLALKCFALGWEGTVWRNPRYVCSEILPTNIVNLRWKETNCKTSFFGP